MRKFEIDMSQGSIFKNIISFAIPLILTNVLQLLYNAVDIIVVGRWAGTQALASVGATSSLNNLIINIFVGMSLGAGVLVSRKFGAGDNEGVRRAVHTAVSVGLFAGILAMLVGEIFSTPLLRLMETPEGAVLQGASLYMRIIYIGMPAQLMYNFCAAILRSVGNTKTPLFILSLTGIVNVVLNLVFVIYFHMGVAGVALATVIANYISALLILYTLIKSDGTYKLRIKHLRICREELLDILKVGLPAGLQGSVFSLSNMVIQSSVNSFGTEAIAGNSAGSNIEGFVYTAMNAFYQATITSISQNYGAKNIKRIYSTITTAILSVAVTGIIFGGSSVIFKHQLLGMYIKDSPVAMDYGIMRINLIGITYFFCGIMEVMAGVLRGLGYSTLPAANSLIGACGFRIFWVIKILPIHKTATFLYACWPISWILVMILHTVSFFIIRKRAFAKIQEI